MHRIMQMTSSAWWRRKKRPTGPNDQSGSLRTRNQRFAQKVDSSQGARIAPRERPVPRRGGVPDPKWGVRAQEWLAILTERGLLWGVEGFIILKNGVGFWQDLWLAGREWVVRKIFPAPVNFESFAQDVLEGRLKSGCQTSERGSHWEKGGSGPVGLTVPHIPHPAGLREEVERAKIFTLDSEEEDLSEDLLEDQAGALRSRLSGAGHEESTR